MHLGCVILQEVLSNTFPKNSSYKRASNNKTTNQQIRTGEGNVAGQGDDASLAADVLELAVGGSGKDFPTMAAQELHPALG